MSTPPDGRPASVHGADLTADRDRTAVALRLLPPDGGNPALDRLTDLAARLLGAPSAQVSLLTTGQLVAGGSGLADGIVGSTGRLQDSLCTVTAASGASLVVADATTDHRVAHLPPVTTGMVSAYLGVPLRTGGGIVVGALCVFGPQPRTWADTDVTLLEQLAASVMAELELSALSSEYETSRLRWDVAIDAAGIGSFSLDLATDLLEWDERLQDLFGYPPGEVVVDLARAFDRIHPEDRPAVDAAIAAAVATGRDYRAEFRVLRPEGGHRWVASRGRTRPGSDGRPAQLIGATYDVTEMRSARDHAAHILDTMATGYLRMDGDWRVTYVNGATERILGFRADELVDQNLWEVFPGLEDLEFGRQYHHAVETGEAVTFESYYPHLSAWFEVRAVPEAGGLALYFLDITTRRAAQEQADVAVARLQLLAAVSAELAATLDPEAAVARLAQLVVPALGDWCIVTLVHDDGMRDVASWHADERWRPVVERYTGLRLAALSDGSFVRQVLRTGEAVRVTHDAQSVVADVLRPGEARDLFAALAPESLNLLPLPGRDRTVGLLSLFRSPDRPALTDADLDVADQVAARAGLALDNARLYDQQRSLAERLQRSLLTDPPEPDHSEIVVRYSPAAESASVGGDWFDSFLQADGATILVIGDVVGHDSEAAAAMGQVRGLLRGIAWHSGAGPAEVLSGLDAAIEGLLVETTATAIVARLEQTEDDLEHGVRVLRWSNAGHPPPMAIDESGRVEILAGTDADLLLGIDPRTSRGESTVALAPGATVLLYTDGLVERRGQGLDEGLNLLRATLAELAPLPLSELCDELLRRMLPERAEDDVALVAVRLHPQDRPRPDEAGPTRVPPHVPDHA